MFASLIRLAKNPAVRRAVAWLAPLFLTWLLNKIDQADKKNQSKKKK